MNMFERMVDDEFEAYEYCVTDIDNQIQNITYTSDVVRISYTPRKDIVECGFLQDDVKVYLTFISTDVSDFSENFSNEALATIAQSDFDCVEKFEEIFKMIFGVKFDRASIDVPSYVFSKGSSSSGEVYVSFYVYYHNTQINVFFSSEEGSKHLTENIKIKELANRISDYGSRLDDLKGI